MNNAITNREGLLQTYNLWDLWDGLGDTFQKKIIEYFQSTPLMWDYTTLFKGKSSGSITHGSINLLSTIFVLESLEFCDKLFIKFKTYNPENYLDNSNWGKNWLKDINYIKRIARDGEYYNSITSENIYWVDFHFFLHQYSKAVYKNYLKGICSIERFENAFLLEYNNLNIIQYSVEKILECNTRNGIIDQYLIYLEKQKRHDECIKLINEVKYKGWKNDFEKRLIRCLSKKNKNDNKS